VTPIFFVIAGMMLAAALALVLRPLLRGAGSGSTAQRRFDALDRALADGVVDEAEFGRKRKAMLAEAGTAPASRAPLLSVLGLSLLLPLGAVLVYLTVGTPEALDPARLVAESAGDPTHGGGQSGGVQMNEAIAGLEQRLRSEPDNVDGWLLLGRAYKSTERFAEAQTALRRAFDLAPNNPDVVVEYAEAIALVDPDRNIVGESRALLDQVIIDQPQHQRALWLLGIADAQVENYTAALSRWEALLPLLEPGSEVIAQVQAQIAEARTRAGLPPAPASAPVAAAPASSAAPAAAAVSGPAITIEIDITPELAARLAPTDVLYVFARPADGSRMPLAMQRLPGAKFPLTLTLDDSMGMMPQLKLSNADSVIVGARVSKSGVANPQSGDLEVLSAPLSPKAQRDTLKLVINSVVP